MTVDASRAGWDLARLLAPHTVLIAGLTDTDASTDSFEAGRLTLNRLVQVLTAAGAYRAVLPLCTAVLVAESQRLGADHSDALTSRSNLAAALGDLGDYRRAADLHQQTLTDRERILGPDHPDTLTSRNNLALARTAIERSRHWRRRGSRENGETAAI